MEFERSVEANYELQTNTWFAGSIKKVDEVIEIRAINIMALNPTVLDQIQKNYPKDTELVLPGFLFSMEPKDENQELYKRLDRNVGKSVRLRYIKEDSKNDGNTNLRLFVDIVDEDIPEEEEYSRLASYQLPIA